MSEHVSEDLALILAALDRDHPERRAALAHAESCPACTRLLERGASVLSLIDAQAPDVKVDPQLKARILASIDKLEEQSSGASWEPYALAIGALLSIVLASFDLRARAGLFPARAPLCFMWQMLGALFSIAGVGIWARSWGRGSSPLRLAVVAMGGALVGQLWLRVRCPTHDAPLHVFTFHLTSVLFAAFVGYILARVIWRSER
jgi:hypothetical protein